MQPTDPLRSALEDAFLLSDFPDGHVIEGEEHELVVRQSSARRRILDLFGVQSDAGFNFALVRDLVARAALAAEARESGAVELKRFADDVQSRIVIVHQLRASADIQDAATKRETGWADTSDRAQLMRRAADTIEKLATTTGSADRESGADDLIGIGEAWRDLKRARHDGQMHIGYRIDLWNCMDEAMAKHLAAHPGAQGGGE